MLLKYSYFDEGAFNVFSDEGWKYVLKIIGGRDFVFNLYGRRLKKYLSEEREKMRTLSA